MDRHELNPPAVPAVSAKRHEGRDALQGTHTHTIRLAPPLVISKDEIDWVVERLAKVLAMA